MLIPLSNNKQKVQYIFRLKLPTIYSVFQKKSAKFKTFVTGKY